MIQTEKGGLQGEQISHEVETTFPYLFFEHKLMYRSVKGLIPDDYYTVPIGKARTVKEGNDITIITYGLGVHWACEVLEEIINVQAEILDLRTLLPIELNQLNCGCC